MRSMNPWTQFLPTGSSPWAARIMLATAVIRPGFHALPRRSSIRMRRTMASSAPTVRRWRSAFASRRVGMPLSRLVKALRWRSIPHSVAAFLMLLWSDRTSSRAQLTDLTAYIVEISENEDGLL